MSERLRRLLADVVKVLSAVVELSLLSRLHSRYTDTVQLVVCCMRTELDLPQKQKHNNNVGNLKVLFCTSHSVSTIILASKSLQSLDFAIVQVRHTTLFSLAVIRIKDKQKRC